LSSGSVTGGPVKTTAAQIFSPGYSSGSGTARGSRRGAVAVIGGGETVTSMLNELLRHRVSTITVISPQVTLFTRGESFFENTLFSDPTGWSSLTLAERRDA
jgi:hypothetical protein